MSANGRLSSPIAPGGASGAADAAPGGQADSADLADPVLAGLSLAEQVAALRVTLAAERQRRRSVEMHLQRLKEETSSAALATPSSTDAELLATKEEIVYLRKALDDERAARQRLAEELLALQERLTQVPPPESPQIRAQQESLQARQQAAAVSFGTSYAQAAAATAALDQQLAVAAEDGDLGAVRAQNAALRSRLEDQYRRTQELSDKLKVATRVAALIFKMEGAPAGQTGGAPGGAPPSRPRAAAAVARPPAPVPDAIESASPAEAVAPPPQRPPVGLAQRAAELPAEPVDTPTTRPRPTRTPTPTPQLQPTPTPTPTSNRPPRRGPEIPLAT